MSKYKRYPLGTFLKTYGSEENCYNYLIKLRWGQGFICPKCGNKGGCRLSNGLFQCSKCRRQTSVTAGTVMHRTHLPLTMWFLAFYFVSQDKRGISAVRLGSMIGVTYKTAWYLLKRIRKAMGQRDDQHQLSGVIEFDDAYFGGVKTGGKRGRGTDKAKVFVALSLDDKGNPQYLKMSVTPNIQHTSVKKFALENIVQGSSIHSDGYRSYIPALKDDFNHLHKKYDPKTGLLHWLHITISNAKAFIQGTYHGLHRSHLQSYLDEFCFRFSRRKFHGNLLDRLVLAMANSVG